MHYRQYRFFRISFGRIKDRLCDYYRQSLNHNNIVLFSGFVSIFGIALLRAGIAGNRLCQGFPDNHSGCCVLKKLQ